MLNQIHLMPLDNAHFEGILKRVKMNFLMTAVTITMLCCISSHARKLGDSTEIASAIYNIDSIEAKGADNTKPYCLMFATMWKGTGLVDTSKNKHLELYKIYGWRDTLSVSKDGDVFRGRELCLDTAGREEDRTIAVYAKFELTNKQRNRLQNRLDSCVTLVVLESDLTTAQRNHFRLKTKHFKGMGNVRLRNQGRRTPCPG